MKTKVWAAGGIVLNQDNELLMIYKRSKWDLPKGHVDKNESFESCALREVKEETGLKTLKIIRFAGITEHEVYENTLRAEVIKETHWFEMRGDKNEQCHAQANESIEWIRWVPRSEIERFLHNSYENIQKIVAKTLKGNSNKF
ncbi:MAG TPA: NUDIX domain-containing protein [Parafilimonas sp.]|nr:NUDIX domain-containing protein [Parafilimonas sp.]